MKYLPTIASILIGLLLSMVCTQVTAIPTCPSYTEIKIAQFDSWGSASNTSVLDTKTQGLADIPDLWVVGSFDVQIGDRHIPATVENVDATSKNGAITEAKIAIANTNALAPVKLYATDGNSVCCYYSTDTNTHTYIFAWVVDP